MQSMQGYYDELSFYTLAHPGPSFIHQHVADAWTAQTADANTRPISLVFALSGLFLYIEKGYTGKQVQQFHQQMAKKKQVWPVIHLPVGRGDITVAHVLAAPPGAERDDMVHAWCASVWNAYQNNKKVIKELIVFPG